MSEGDNDPVAAAAAIGQVVKRPQANELFVDIDDEESLNMFGKALAILNRQNDPEWGYTISASPSGEPHHYHAVVTMNEPADVRVRVGLQAILGSDRTREALSWNRAKLGRLDPTVFFEHPPTAMTPEAAS